MHSTRGVRRERHNTIRLSVRGAEVIHIRFDRIRRRQWRTETDSDDATSPLF